MSNELCVTIISAIGELFVQIGRPVRRQVCTDMPRAQWWIIETITAPEIQLRQLVTSHEGVMFSDDDFNATVDFSGTELGSETMSIPHDRLEAQDLDGLGAFSVWDIDIDSFDYDLEMEVIETFQKLLEA